MRILLATILLLALGCTEYRRLPTVSEPYRIILPQGRKLVNVSWQRGTIVILSRVMKADEEPETYSMDEYAVGGIFGFAYTIMERR